LIKTINYYLIKIGALSVFLTLGFIIAGLFYIKFFLPNTFQGAILYFVITVLGLPAGTLAIILYTILESQLRYKELVIIGIIPNLLKIILILVFGRCWQIIGICIALAINGWIDLGFYYLLTLKRELVIRFITRHQWLNKLSQKY